MFVRCDMAFIEPMYCLTTQYWLLLDGFISIFLSLICIHLVILHCVCNTSPWRHNERGGVSNHQPHDCLLNRLFRRRSKKLINIELPAQKASNAENVPIWWRHQDCRTQEHSSTGRHISRHYITILRLNFTGYWLLEYLFVHQTASFKMADEILPYITALREAASI